MVPLSIHSVSMPAPLGSNVVLLLAVSIRSTRWFHASIRMVASVPIVEPQPTALMLQLPAPALYVRAIVAHSVQSVSTQHPFVLHVLQSPTGRQLQGLPVLTVQTVKSRPAHKDIQYVSLVGPLEVAQTDRTLMLLLIDASIRTVVIWQFAELEHSARMYWLPESATNAHVLSATLGLPLATSQRIVIAQKTTPGMVRAAVPVMATQSPPRDQHLERRWVAAHARTTTHGTAAAVCHAQLVLQQAGLLRQGMRARVDVMLGV